MTDNINQFCTNKLYKIRDLILNNLYDIVANQTLLLYGQAISSKLVKKYFINSGASHVINLPMPKKMATNTSSLFQIQNDGLLNPSKKMSKYLCKIDPRREAKIYAGSSISAEKLDNRKVIGKRLSAWREFERKKFQVELTKMQGEYIPNYFDFSDGIKIYDILEYCKQNRPCVLSGDPKGCLAMGADYVYLIQIDTPMKMIIKICNMLYEKCEGVRIANFNEGIPATYYGFVSDDQHILYGPVEAIVGFRNKDYRVIAPGILIPLVLTEELIKKAQEDVLIILKRIVDRTGYKGAFGVDGCIKKNGFIVHEINTRICAGFSLISKLYHNTIPFGLIDLIIREGKFEKYSPLLNMLQHDVDKVFTSVNLKLWDNIKLENYLIKKIPKNDEVNDLENWKILVRNKTLSNCTPFYSFRVSNHL
jgi:hypothetical protein